MRIQTHVAYASTMASDCTTDAAQPKARGSLQGFQEAPLCGRQRPLESAEGAQRGAAADFGF